MITRKDFITASPFIFVNTNRNKHEYLNRPIVVLGGSGYLGSDCVKGLANNKLRVRSVSRNPFRIDDKDIDNNYVEYKSADVLQSESKALNDVIKDAYAVIYTINAKKRGNINNENDNNNIQSYSDTCVNGLINTANLCIFHGVKRLVVVSASCISCNEDYNNKIDKTCGLKCDHCRAKQEGEIALKQLYLYQKNNNNNNGYTIIRTGILTIGEKRGVGEIEINQDYSKSGMISRLDLADLCINSIFNENTKDTTFEAYYRDTIQPVDVKKSLTTCMELGKSLEECFFGSEYKNKKPKNLDETLKTPIKGTLFATGNEMNGKTWNQLFKNLKKDTYKDIDIFNINSALS
jgi:putative NADH-flavin reductase